MNYARINKNDIANGPGVRVTLFVSGCRRNCKGCFNKEAQSFSYGAPFTEQTVEEILNALAPAHITGLTLLGGEPFEPSNQKRLLPFVKKVREELPNKTIWAFSGFTFEELTDPDSYPYCETTVKLLSLIDVLVDGRYIEAKKDISLRFRGSSNQRLIDLKETLKKGETVLWEG